MGGLIDFMQKFHRILNFELGTSVVQHPGGFRCSNSPWNNHLYSFACKISYQREQLQEILRTALG